jgi:hypothetical protein
LVLTLAYTAPTNAQWRELYATWDDDSANVNATGHNTTNVAVIHEDMFIALVMTRGERNFMIPYVNADSSHGRKYTFGYGGTATLGIYQLWTDGAFDEVRMFNAFSITATPDSFIYVANNNDPITGNDPDHNVLVFKYINDTITVVPPYPRQITGPNGIYGIEVDQAGRVYVCNDTSIGVTNDLKIFKPINQWSTAHTDLPIRTIDLPDGIYKGITVSPDGSQIFVADYGNRRILKYVGSPNTGYTQATGFHFQLGAADTISAIPPKRASVIGLGYLSPNNILFAACDSLFGGGTAYSYGRVYLINPNTGALVSSDSSISVIDVAKWNFALTGGYNLRTKGKIPGNASGYTSTYDVEFDQKGNLYSQSHYGWTVEKWRYNGTLPIIAGVEEIEGKIPDSYKLLQNYPNPFNPSTTIEFSVLKSGLVTMKVFNLLGQEMATLVNEAKGPGTYRVTFDARSLPSGTYFYTLRAEGYSEMKKMLLIK